MTMVDKYLTIEMFKFNALSQFIVALFIYHRGWPCDLFQGRSIQGHKAKEFGLKAKVKD